MNIKKLFQPSFLALGLLISAIGLISVVTSLTFGESNYSYTIRNETKIAPDNTDDASEKVSGNNTGE